MFYLKKFVHDWVIHPLCCDVPARLIDAGKRFHDKHAKWTFD